MLRKYFKQLGQNIDRHEYQNQVYTETVCTITFILSVPPRQDAATHRMNSLKL